MNWHLFLQSSFSHFQLILSQQIAWVTSAERLAPPEYAQAVFPSQFVFVSVPPVDLTIVLHFGVIRLQFISGLKLCIDFGLRSVVQIVLWL